MSSEKTTMQDSGIRRRDLLKVGAAGVAAAGAAGIGMQNAAAENKAPGKNLQTNAKDGVRTAIITDTQLNIGPYLAKEFARLNYNLVIADVQKGLEKDLRKLGANKVLVVPGIEQEGPNNEGKPGQIQKVVDAAMDEFGGYDSVFIRTAAHVGANIFEETDEDRQVSYEQNYLGVVYALQAVLPPLVAAGGGQVVVQTSATGEKPHPGMFSYSCMRAAANMACRCAALSVAPDNVTVNAVGTNFMNYPGFKEATGADDPEIYKKILATIPMGRLGETAEAAHFSLALLDGHNMYTTGGFYPVSGGFNNSGM